MSSDRRGLPYYRWYVADYRASRAVQRMDYIVRGLYRELLDECWVEGAIPDDAEKLADICGCPVDVMANAWKVLKPRFSPLVGMDSYLTMTRLEVERTESDKIRTVRALAGAKGGRAAAAKASKGKQKQAKGTAVKSSSSSSSKSSSKSKTNPLVTPAAELQPKTAQLIQLGAVLARLKAEAQQEQVS